MNLNEQIEHYKAVRARISNAKPKISTKKIVEKEPEPEKEIPQIRINPGSRLHVVHECAEQFGVTIADIMGNSKVKKIMLARREAMWRLHKFKGMSKNNIGSFLNKDHSTVVYAITAYEKQIG